MFFYKIVTSYLKHVYAIFFLMKQSKLYENKQVFQAGN